MKILIYGAGVVGSIYAARLCEAGHDVSILARGQRLADLREHGIVLEAAATGRRTVTHVNVVASLEPDDGYDLVIVVMRKNQVPAVLPVLAANRHTPDVLFLGNNAAGPDAWIKALGRERVLLGFGGAGGVREGNVIRYVSTERGNQGRTILGEPDGRVTPRIARIAGAFDGTGLPATVSPDIDAWLKTHAAVVSPITCGIYMAGGDNYRLARTRDALVLVTRGVREGLQVLRALGVPITPTRLRLFELLPEPLLIHIMRRTLNTRDAEIGVAGHANAARDEMRQLAEEFQALSDATVVPTPALDHLHAHLDPAVPPTDEGSSELPLNWRGVWLGLGALTGLIALFRFWLRQSVKTGGSLRNGAVKGETTHDAVKHDA